jgi:hypothetical protein
MSSSADLTKEAASNDTSDEEDSAVDINSRPNSNFSNFSSVFNILVEENDI